MICGPLGGLWRAVLAALLAFVLPAVRAQGCGSVAELTCPATDPVTPVRGGYDPAAVDWGAVVGDLAAVWGLEPRFCNSVIRAWFHDIGQHFHQDQSGMPFDGGADASFITDLVEAAHIESSRHGFGQFARHIIVPVARTHGASHADVLTVAAAKCTTGGLGGQVDIASHCEAQGFPLYVGKLDYERPDGINDQMIGTKATNPPTSHTRMTGLLEMFNIEINSWIEEEQWKVTPAETTALMGAHTLVMTYACTTTGAAADGAATAALGDRTCGGAGGRQRMFTWDNSFFMDVTAGRCLQDAGQNGRDFTPAEKAEFTQCGFSSMEAFELNEHLECDGLGGAIDELLAGPDGDLRLSAVRAVGSLDEAWRDVVWRPGGDAAPCCGLQCETCEEPSPEKFWCGGNIGGDARFWPYTYMDCEFNEVYNLGGAAYCAGGEGDFSCPSCATQCDFDWVQLRGHPRQDFIDMLDGMQAALVRFRESSAAWEEEYATAFCKLSSFGASFAPGKVSFEDVFSGPSQPCLSVAETLSLQQCPVCDLAHYDSISGVGGGNVPPPPAADSPPAPAPAPAEPPVEDPSSADSAVPDDSAVPALEARATTQPAAGPGAADSAAPIVEEE